MIPYLLPQAIEQACARWPDQPAVVDCDGAVLSYAQLERSSRAWAARLQSAGSIARARVGVWMPKSTAAVIAQLAILRAGAVYVPLDAWAPSARIEAMAADCSLRLLLTDPRGIAAAGQWSAPPVCWDFAPPLSSPPGSWQAPAATGDDLAYILYTSGSTGIPKGVMLTHTHALNFTEWAAEQVNLGPGDRVASHAPFHFDLSIFDLWASLSRGATVCLLDPVSARFPRAVADWITDRQITVWYSVPSALTAMTPLLPAMAPGFVLRRVIFAGEVFPLPALRTWRAALPHASFHNWFGPTETNVCSHFTLLPSAAATPDPLPIGRACPNFELAVWNDSGDPVTPGEAGFLWARGPGILAGYWGDPVRSAAVTCERAVEGGHAQRWYNTGDLVHQDAAGLLHFLGRRDHLIKCRGYRISLPEIERALEALPEVARAAVVATPDPDHATGLRAFILPAQQGAPATLAAQLRSALGFSLPGYMIPDLIDICEQLPETSSGKIDRQQLQRAATPAA